MHLPIIRSQPLSFPPLPQLSPPIFPLPPSIPPLSRRILRFFPRVERVVGKDAIIIVVRDRQSRVLPVPPVTGDWQSGRKESFTVLGRVDMNTPRSKIADLPRSIPTILVRSHRSEPPTRTSELTSKADERPRSRAPNHPDYNSHKYSDDSCPHTDKLPVPGSL